MFGLGNRVGIWQVKMWECSYFSWFKRWRVLNLILDRQHIYWFLLKILKILPRAPAFLEIDYWEGRSNTDYRVTLVMNIIHSLFQSVKCNTQIAKWNTVTVFYRSIKYSVSQRETLLCLEMFMERPLIKPLVTGILFLTGQYQINCPWSADSKLLLKKNCFHFLHSWKLH